MTERRRHHTPAAIHTSVTRILPRGAETIASPGRWEVTDTREIDLRSLFSFRDKNEPRERLNFPEKQVVSQRAPVRYRQLKLSRPAWHPLLDEKASACTTAKKQGREFLPELNSKPD